jgi:hypothetical protein
LETDAVYGWGLPVSLYQAGQLYQKHRTRWPHASEYNYRSGKHELLLFIPDVTEREIEDVRHGPADFGLLVDGDIIFSVLSTWHFRIEVGTVIGLTP